LYSILSDYYYYYYKQKVVEYLQSQHIFLIKKKTME